jgi:tetratricopeptide (TPR) repeat protein
MLLRLTAAAAGASLLLVAGAAAAPQPAPTTTPTTTAPATTTPAGPPALSSLRLPGVISAQQGHARFLVGVKLSSPAKLTVQVLSGKKVVQTLTDRTNRPAGRVYLRIEAVDTSGFQLLQGAYKMRLQATDAQGRVSTPLQGSFRLRLTPPHGLFDAYTIPLWRTFRRQAQADSGQLVVVVAPKGTAAKAGLRRGDVITKLNAVDVGTPGAMSVALRALPAETDVPVEVLRKGSPLTLTLQPTPDWEKAPDYAPALRVARRRDPKIFAYAVAQARQRIEAGEPGDATTLIAAWPASWRKSAPGQLLQGDILAAQKKWKPALGAYSRAHANDPTLALAEFNRGVAQSSLNKTAPSVRSFTAAARLDPADPAASGFLAYALLREDKTADAVAAGQKAVGLDNRYADAFLPLGIALIADGDKVNGVKALRRGLILLEEPDRADRLIRQHLEKADP